MDRSKKAKPTGARNGDPRTRPKNRVQNRAMFRIRLSNFRCFAEDTPSVEVLPITFLVGENSAGKTSFLAATRILLESFTPGSLNPFNRDPYHLGGFEQIAHYRGGPVGRAGKFCLELTTSSPAGARHKFTFVTGCCSDDPHVVAVVQMSGCGLIFSRDKNLHKDVHNRDIVNHGVSIYQCKDHDHLLTECKCKPQE